jgi:hypothetical protein
MWCVSLEIEIQAINEIEIQAIKIIVPPARRQQQGETTR